VWLVAVRMLPGSGAALLKSGRSANLRSDVLSIEMKLMPMADRLAHYRDETARAAGLLQHSRTLFASVVIRWRFIPGYDLCQ